MRSRSAIAGTPLRRLGRAIAIGLALLLLTLAPRAEAQQSVPVRGILAPGDAAVAGFSGVNVPVTLSRGADPAELTFIDRRGPSLRIVDLSDMGGPLDARLVPAPKPLTFTAEDIGQVFGVALDDASPPNIYVAASSAYGLPIAVGDPGGTLRHVKAGQKGARFMDGQWGLASKDGGPGSIWKIDGVTGHVSLFHNVTSGGRTNSGPALGGLVFDPDSGALLVSDRESGLIHAISASGQELWRYDHGVEGRAAAGLPPIAGDGSKRLDITSTAFDSTNPNTWGLAPADRRIFGLGIHGRRLYYAVARGLQIWSIAIDALANGREPRFEIAVPPATAATEISKILFDGEGRMILAERARSSGAFDFNLLTTPNAGRVLRYAIVASPDGHTRTWQPVPNEYAIGFPAAYQNANGGAALGYAYDWWGSRDRQHCSAFLWSTGESLRQSPDPALVKYLEPKGPLAVNGLQGNQIRSVRPDNAPPLSAYFIDYDDRFSTETLAGHLGDLDIWQTCGPDLGGVWHLPGWAGWTWWGDGGKVPPPGPSCPKDQKKPGVTCCPKGTSPDGGGSCKPWCPNGAMDIASQKMCAFGFDNASLNGNDPGALTCIGGAKPKAGLGLKSCIEASPFFNPPQCAAGFVKTSVDGNISICAPSPEQTACPFGQQINPFTKNCEILCNDGVAWPGEQCCAAGAKLDGFGKCCPAGATVDLNTGQCKENVTVPGCPKSVVSNTTTDDLCPKNSSCPSGAAPDPKTGECHSEITFCPGGTTPDPTTGLCPSAPPPPGCLPGDKGETCTPTPACPPFAKAVGGACCTAADLLPGGACAQLVCGPGKSLLKGSDACCNADKIYKTKTGAEACCTSGPVKNGQCGDTPLTGVPAFPGCSPGQSADCCEEGYLPTKDGMCCLASQTTKTGTCCPEGQSPNKNGACSATVTGGPPGIPSDEPPPTTKVCCASGSIPVAAGGCCAVDSVTTTGQCCPQGEAPNPDNPATCLAKTITTTPVLPEGPKDLDQGLCAPGYVAMADGSCCQQSKISADGTVCREDDVDVPIKNMLKPGRNGTTTKNGRPPPVETPAATMRKADPVETPKRTKSPATTDKITPKEEPPKRVTSEPPKAVRTKPKNNSNQDINKAQEILKAIIPKLKNGTAGKKSNGSGSSTTSRTPPRTNLSPQNVKP